MRDPGRWNQSISLSTQLMNLWSAHFTGPLCLLAPPSKLLWVLSPPPPPFPVRIPPSSLGLSSAPDSPVSPALIREQMLSAAQCSPPGIRTAAVGAQPVAARTWTVTPALLPNCTLLRLDFLNLSVLKSLHCVATNTLYPNPVGALAASGAGPCPDFVFCLCFPCARCSSSSPLTQGSVPC